MDSAHRMRCWMWRSSVRLDSLATGLILQYSPAYGNETDEVQTSIQGTHCDHAAVWFLGLCQALGAEAERAQATGRGRAFHGARAWRQTGRSRRVFQWLGQGCDADEDRGWFFGLVGRCAAG